MRLTTKTLMIILAVLVIALLGFVSGCNPNSSDELLKLRQPVSPFAQQWIDKYGENPESERNYNLALMLQTLNQQVQAMAALEVKISKLTKIIGGYQFDANDPENTIIDAISLHTNAINQFRTQIDKNTAKLYYVGPLDVAANGKNVILVTEPNYIEDCTNPSPCPIRHDIRPKKPK